MKTTFLPVKKGADQLWSNCTACSNCKLISVFVFATQIVQLLLFLNLKFQDSSFLLKLQRRVCVGPGQQSRRPVFLCRGTLILKQHSLFCDLTPQLTISSHVWTELQIPVYEPVLWGVIMSIAQGHNSAQLSVFSLILYH